MKQGDTIEVTMGEWLDAKVPDLEPGDSVTITVTEAGPELVLEIANPHGVWRQDPA